MVNEGTPTPPQQPDPRDILPPEKYEELLARKKRVVNKIIGQNTSLEMQAIDRFKAFVIRELAYCKDLSKIKKEKDRFIGQSIREERFIEAIKEIPLENFANFVRRIREETSGDPGVGLSISGDLFDLGVDMTELNKIIEQ